jgi:ABC-type Na+ efflux pump permease subunit
MPLTQQLGGRGRQISEFEASLVYRVSSRTARATQRTLSGKTKTQQTKKPNKQKESILGFFLFFGFFVLFLLFLFCFVLFLLFRDLLMFFKDYRFF